METPTLRVQIEGGALHTPPFASGSGLEVRERDQIILSVTFLQEAGSTYTVAWLHNGVTLTTSSPSPQLLLIEQARPADAGNYQAVVTRDHDQASSASAIASIVVLFRPTIVTQPAPLTQLLPGDIFALSVVAIGEPSPTFTWYHDGQLLTNQTQPELIIDAITDEDEGVYTAHVLNSQGSVISMDAVLTVFNVPVVIFQPPLHTVVDPGQRVALEVLFTGSPFPSIAWYKNGVAMPGRTFSQLTFPSVTELDEGTYVALITNPVGSVSSAPAELTVNNPPVILSHPTAAPASVVDPGQWLVITVNVTGTEPLTFEWFRNGLLIQTTATGTLNLSAVKEADEGTYRVRISNSAGSQTSDGILIAVNNPPRFTSFPGSGNADAPFFRYRGDHVMFSVSVDGDPAPVLQWMVCVTL